MLPKTLTIRAGQASDREALLAIWDRSVRATHDFLAEEDIAFFYPLVRDFALVELELWVLVDERDRALGFMGLNDNKLEALFLEPDQLRQGGGRRLVEHARELKGPLRVDVNEQNPRACAFYRALGFRQAGRSERDATGRPFPVLHLREVGAR